MDTKRCGKCREFLPFTDFIPRRDKPDKYLPNCKACRGTKSGGLQRGGGLKRTPMNRGGSQMKRTPIKQTPMKRVSAQPNEYELEFRKMKPIVRQRSKYQCEAKTDVCIGSGQHIHHRKLRSRGGTNSEANLIDVCMPCHEWIHAHPALSYQHRWLLHGHDEETPLR